MKISAALVAFTVTVAGCAQAPVDGPDSSAAATVQSAQPGAPGHRSGPLGTLTANGLVTELVANGYDMVHPVDTTHQECRRIGCEQSVVTDRLRIKSFSSTGAAQKHAGQTTDARQVESIVVEFAPVVPDEERERYWAEIVKLVTSG